jgi:hypothetical protein
MILHILATGNEQLSGNQGGGIAVIAILLGLAIFFGIKGGKGGGKGGGFGP